MLSLLREALDHGGDQGLQLGAGVAVDVEVAAEGVAYLGLVALTPPVLAEHEHPPFPAQLVHPRAVVAGHGEDQVGLLHQLTREQARAVSREVEAALQAHQIGSLGGGRAVPRPGTGRGDAHACHAAFLERAAQEGFGQRAAADVAGADEQNSLDHAGQGARIPAARRSSLIGSAPARTTRGVGLVQSTTVEGGRFPSTPPSSTSNWPVVIAAAKSRATGSAPGAGGDRKSTRLNSSHSQISYAVFCLKKKKTNKMAQFLTGEDDGRVELLSRVAV